MSRFADLIAELERDYPEEMKQAEEWARFFIHEVKAGRKRLDIRPWPPEPDSNRCLACGKFHYGLSGLPCPDMKITAQNS
ncbi:hypothetical protein N7403_20675 [Pseudomonas nitroreducens]|uniref:hypothetical protein n=1 Tax=Pseudomonas nitroreducens TaxID=46680 RepID=UPI00244A53A3|nr:hypothetical protein [Pseudomonas nitroreducens]MDG9856288.1 hypothetical protein [Pseudomonas nitroreducens]